jgi:hypothetical protein
VSVKARCVPSGDQEGTKKKEGSGISIRHHQPVFASFVVEPGDLHPVGRPDGMPVSDTGAAGDVAPAPLLGGNRIQVAAVLEEGPLSRGGEAGIPQPGGRDILPARPGPVLIGSHPDLQLADFPGGGIKLMEPASLFIDHDTVAGAEALDIEVRMEGQLFFLTGAGIEGPDVGRIVPL